MSKKEAPIGLTIMEKLVSLLIIAIGAITFYVTYNNLASSSNPVFFLAAALALVAIGIFLLTARAE